MRVTAIFLIMTLALLMSLAIWQGTETFMAGLRTSITQLLRFLPVLVVAMLVAGFAETLMPQDFIERWLSDSSGWRGLGIAWLAGILTPGGSIIGMPLIAVLYKAGVGVSVLMTYATSMVLLSVMRIPIEVGFYGWRLTGLRVAVSLILPIIAGLLTQFILSIVDS
ncbi:MAG: permease [Bacteroidota bacterium]